MRELCRLLGHLCTKSDQLQGFCLTVTEMAIGSSQPNGSSRPLPVVIAGGGCVGLFLALLLAQSDILNHVIVRHSNITALPQCFPPKLSTQHSCCAGHRAMSSRSHVHPRNGAPTAYIPSLRTRRSNAWSLPRWHVLERTMLQEECEEWIRAHCGKAV